MEMGVPWKIRRGRPRRRWLQDTREDMNKYEMTSDMTENRHYWKMVAKTTLKKNQDSILLFLFVVWST